MGLGFGGPCLEKDLRALIGLAATDGSQTQLLQAVLDRNTNQVGEIISKLKQLVGFPLYQKKVVAVLGLSFKAGTNYVRNSAALKVIERLVKEGAVVRAYDPVVSLDSQTLGCLAVSCDEAYEAVDYADAVMILTDWACFKDLDYREVKNRMAFPRIVDASNLLDPQSVRELGFEYAGVGYQ